VLVANTNIQHTYPPPANPYFIFCGAAVYIEVIKFIIDAFDILTENEYLLYLVVNGNARQKEMVKKIIENSRRKESIKMYSELAYPDLIDLYVNAKGLLIPLRPTLQDNARFPHKIGEYVSSGNPMITTGFGEINQYFTDGLNALISDKYDRYSFAQKMQFVIDHPIKAREIGKSGKMIALNYFDHVKNSLVIRSFIEEINNQKRYK
jgi:glycosyltransferase involved in cell wall biosynthesis